MPSNGNTEKPLNPGGEPPSGSVSPVSPNPKPATSWGTMLAPSELTWLRQDFSETVQRLTELPRVPAAS